MKKSLILAPMDRAHLIVRESVTKEKDGHKVSSEKKILDVAFIAGTGRFVKVTIEVESYDYDGQVAEDDLPEFSGRNVDLFCNEDI